jgi:hypothetical protein
LLSHSCHFQPPAESFLAHRWGAHETRGVGGGAGRRGDGAATSRGDSGEQGDGVATMGGTRDWSGGDRRHAGSEQRHMVGARGQWAGNTQGGRGLGRLNARGGRGLDRLGVSRIGRCGPGDVSLVYQP